MGTIDPVGMEWPQ